jgi:hypothetical protein
LHGIPFPKKNNNGKHRSNNKSFCPNSHIGSIDRAILIFSLLVREGSGGGCIGIDVGGGGVKCIISSICELYDDDDDDDDDAAADDNGDAAVAAGGADTNFET